MNPTIDVLEKRIAALEGGVAGLALASGQAASACSRSRTSRRAGDNVVTSTDLYGGTWNLFANTLKDQGIEVRFVDPADPENFRRATDEKTRAYYAETLPNPKLAVFPIAEVADDRPRARRAADHGQHGRARCCAGRFDHGAAIVVYSTTKYIGGHGTSIGGMIVDGGNFDWEANADRFPTAEHARPQLPRRGVDRGGEADRADRLHHQAPARCCCAISARRCRPFNAFQFLQGLETLPLRMRAALRERPGGRRDLAEGPPGRDQGHPPVAADRRDAAAGRPLPVGRLSAGCSASSWRAARRPGRKFIDALKLFYHVANIGDARSLAIHPASTTHSQLSPEEQLATGVTPGYVRLSIGIEHIDDIIADLSQALDAAKA